MSWRRSEKADPRKAEFQDIHLDFLSFWIDSAVRVGASGQEDRRGVQRSARFASAAPDPVLAPFLFIVGKLNRNSVRIAKSDALYI
jgi:hypothetical protein